MQKIVDIFSKEFFGIINMFSCLFLYFEFKDYLNQCHKDLNVKYEFNKYFLTWEKYYKKIRYLEKIFKYLKYLLFIYI